MPRFYLLFCMAVFSGCISVVVASCMANYIIHEELLVPPASMTSDEYIRFDRTFLFSFLFMLSIPMIVSFRKAGLIGWPVILYVGMPVLSWFTLSFLMNWVVWTLTAGVAWLESMTLLSKNSR